MQAEAKRVAVSLKGDAGADATHAGDVTDAPNRADLQRMFKARCPGRVERLLGVALPAERPDFKVIADICACATTAMEGAPADTSAEQFKSQAAQSALACSKNTITAHNERRTRKALGPYLAAQGMDTQQVTAFSQCAADTHWQNTVSAARDAPPAESGAWWSTCTERVGRKGLPEPRN